LSAAEISIQVAEAAQLELLAAKVAAHRVGARPAHEHDAVQPVGSRAQADIGVAHDAVAGKAHLRYDRVQDFIVGRPIRPGQAEAGGDDVRLVRAGRLDRFLQRAVDVAGHLSDAVLVIAVSASANADHAAGLIGDDANRFAVSSIHSHKQQDSPLLFPIVDQ